MFVRWALSAACCSATILGAATSPPPDPQASPSPDAVVRPIYIREYRVSGAHVLPPIEIQEAVYPFLGPGRFQADVNQACAAVEKIYKDKGFEAVSVQMLPYPPRGGIVRLQVLEGTVAKVRVHGSRYFLPSQIKAAVPSLIEGRPVNINDVTRDIVALNRLADRRVTPSLTAGEVPGTVDIDLTVKDSFPLHGSLELNNRYSSGTTPLRLDGAISYNNLWQRGDSLGGSFQLSPQDFSEVKVYSAYYILRPQNPGWLSLTVSGTKQDSNVSTLSALAVAGKGETAGLRATFTLPSGPDFYQSASVGVDYKKYNQGLTVAGVRTDTPIHYYPISANYSATWAPKGAITELNAGVTLSLRGSGSRDPEFELNRHGSRGDFIYLRGDLSHTHDLPAGFQAFAKVQGQISSQPLLNSEQFAGGGLGTVRGYLEAEQLGDNAIGGSVELRSPSLLSLFKDKADDWRVYAFADAVRLTIRNPLPEQKSQFNLASVGVGTRARLFDHFNGSLDVALPLTNDGTDTLADQVVLTFRVWAEF